MKINEKEFAIIREISANHLPDQRTLAKKVGISLGLTNLIIKRLINTGYVKAKQLNRRKIQYILTPKGFAEKAKKSYNFTIRTINTLTLMKQKIQSIILAEYGNGRRDFVIKCDDETVGIVDLAFREINKPDIHVYHAQESRNISLAAPFYFYSEMEGNGKPAGDGIDVLTVLSENF